MSDANSWRITVGRKFAEIYRDVPNVTAVAIVGSVSYEMADRYSDLDLRVFWREFPSETDHRVMKERALIMGQYDSALKMDGSQFDEVFFFGGDADSGFQIDIKNTLTEPVERALQDPDIEKNIGILEVMKNASPLVGKNTFRDWHSRIQKYPDQLIDKRVQEHLQVGPWWLWEQFVDEGETVLTTRAFRRVLERLLVALTWLSQSSVRHAEYAKHAAQALGRMEVCPKNAWSRIQQIFQCEPQIGLRRLGEFVEETHGLVAKHRPGVEVEKLRSETFSDRPTNLVRSIGNALSQKQYRSSPLNAIADAYGSTPGVRALVLSGDVSRRLTNYAAMELTAYWTEIPTDEKRNDLVESVGGIQRKDYGYHSGQSVWRERMQAGSTSFNIRHMSCQTFDLLLQDISSGLEMAQSGQTEISQLRGGLTLFGGEWLDSHITQSDSYPFELGRVTIRTALDKALWWREQIRVFSQRNGLVYYPILIHQAQAIYQALMAQNRMYLVERWSRDDAFFENNSGWDRVNPLLDAMTDTPIDFKRRFNELFHQSADQGALEIDRLISETLRIVKEADPDLDVETDVAKQAMKRRKAWNEPPDTAVA